MKELKIQDRLAKCKDDISSLMAKDDQAWLLNYFKIPDFSLIESWLSGQKAPTGLNMIRLAFYLYERHFVLTELIDANEVVIQVIAILANGIATPREAADEIGYKEEYDLYKVLLGKRNYSSGAYRAMQLFVETCEHKEGQLVSSDPAQDQLTIDLLHTIGSSCLCVKPLLERLIQSTPEERQNLRNSLSKDGRSMFQVSNSFFRVAELMNALCSEKAIENYKHKTKGRKNA